MTNDKYKMLATAIMIATNAHYGQYDKADKPYILHPLKVMDLLGSNDPELMAIAVLHDVIEDTKITYVELLDAGLSERIIAGVEAMTKRRGQTVEQYKDQVKANPDAIKVKMADLRHNSDLGRMIDVTTKDFERAAKYMKFYKELELING